MSTPWTQTITLTWRPELRFYEHRISILRVLEDRGDLNAFQVQDRQIHARIFDARHQISVEQSGLSLHLLGQDCDAKPAWDVVRLVLDQIRPTHPREISTSFQHVVEVDVPFADAMNRGYSHMFSSLPRAPGAIKLGDWAFLANLELGPPTMATGLIEFGVVEAHEVITRLMRATGRTGGEPPPYSGPEIWQGAAFPDVALFSDMTLLKPVAAGADLPSEAMAYWEVSRQEAATLIVDLHSRLSDDDNHQGGGLLDEQHGSS